MHSVVGESIKDSKEASDETVEEEGYIVDSINGDSGVLSQSATLETMLELVWGDLSLLVEEINKSSSVNSLKFSLRLSNSVN